MNNRLLTSHIVPGDPALQLKIEVIGERGPGGAWHYYRISGCDISKNPSADPEWYPLNTNIFFQNGPILEAGVNGITETALLAILIDRLESFQSGAFACRENAIALTKGQEMLMWLQQRTMTRIRRGAEGTSQP